LEIVLHLPEKSKSSRWPNLPVDEFDPLEQLPARFKKKERPIRFLIDAVRGPATADLVFDIPFAQH
jgi:hypothetical protein